MHVNLQVGAVVEAGIHPPVVVLWVVVPQVVLVGTPVVDTAGLEGVQHIVVGVHHTVVGVDHTLLVVVRNQPVVVDRNRPVAVHIPAGVGHIPLEAARTLPVGNLEAVVHTGAVQRSLPAVHRTEMKILN